MTDNTFTACRNFAIITARGSTMYLEGQPVPEAVALAYEAHIASPATAGGVRRHNPYKTRQPERSGPDKPGQPGKGAA